MRIRVLGPVVAEGADGGALALGARRHTELLALLAAEAGRPVPADVLADRLWRGAPPPSAPVTLQGYVARVRRALGADAGRLVSVPGGYLLDLAPGDVDAGAARDAVREARSLLGRGRPGEALALLEPVLARWHAPAYAEVADVDALAPLLAALEELRQDAEELRARALLDDDRAGDAVPPLRSLVAAHPLRESAARLLAVALYRSGRQADALDVLDGLRHRLADELGLDPSPGTRDLHEALLRQDDGLLGPPGPPATGTTDGAGTSSAPAAGPPGREAELLVLAEARSRAEAGHLAAVTVVGEPGIGKTTLVEALAATWTPRGVRRGRATDLEGAPPYWVWQQVLGGLVTGAADGHGARDRFSAGLAVVAHLRAAAQEDGPLLLLLDDLQWADPDSLAVLDVLLRTAPDLPVLLAVTCRSGSPSVAVRTALASLARVPGARRVELHGLDEPALAALVRSRSGRSPAPAEVRLLLERSGGNPFLAGELVDSPAGVGAEVPSGVVDVVAARTATLPPAAVDVLRLAAVVGRDVAPAVLRAALPADGGELDAALAPLLSAALLVEPAPGLVGFRHDLVREGVLASLPPGLRQRLHLTAADALARVQGPVAAAAVAVHRSEAAAGGTDAGAAAACLEAAEAALDQGATAEAASLARRGLVHARGLPPADRPPAAGAEGRTEVVPSLWRVLGSASRRSGDLEQASTACAEEAALARARDDVVALADVALSAAPGRLGGYWSGYATTMLGPDPLVAEALAHGDRLDADRLAALHATDAIHRAASGAPGGTAAATRARSLVGRAGPDLAGRTRDRVDVASFLVGWEPSSTTERAALAERLLARSQHPADRASALHLVRVTQLEAGRLADSERTARRFDELARRRWDGELVVMQAWWGVMGHLLRGEHGAARALAEQATARVDVASPSAAAVLRMSRSSVEGVIAWHEGRLLDEVDEAVALAAGTDDDFRLVVALGLAEGGAGTRAVALVEELLAGVETWEPPRRVVRTVLLGQALVALWRRPATAAAATRLAAALEPTTESWEDGMVVFWPGIQCLGPTRWHRGTVRAVLGRAGAAADLERAVALAREARAEPYLRRAEALLQLLR